MNRLFDLPATLAVVPVLMGVTVIAVGVLRSPAGRVGIAGLVASLGLGLEFFLAAGLLRLSSIEDFSGLGTVAAVVVMRRVISIGIRSGLRAVRAAGIQRIRA